MRAQMVSIFSTCCLALTLALDSAAQNTYPLRIITHTDDASRASVRVHTARKAADPIPAYITGKFAEHLGVNIYNGMDAQILRNPTFAPLLFWNGQMTPDGVTKFHSEDEKIVDEVRRQAMRFGYPESELEELLRSRTDALACFWTREGPRDQVQPSPDTGPHGGRAQRITVKSAGHGIAQWVYLPLHRVREYQVELFARSPDVASLSISLKPHNGTNTVASASIRGISPVWQKFTATLIVDQAAPPEAKYKLSLSADTPGQFVLQRALLRPSDHINGSDPDVVQFLKASKLPMLRWPGGNFVSGYHWEDGVGPLERRPTRPNYAWGGVEPNLFGTDEFMAFCRAVGAEPMICINAGDGTPAEAARWIEYCNGPVTSPLGALRAAHGHPPPYNVKHWEVGNELWGKWQFHWTTAAGYVDRYKQFAAAMLQADPAIELYACGAPAFSDRQWNETLISGAATSMRHLTDHPLIGGTVPSTTDPLDVYRDFMAVPEVLAMKWSRLREEMIQAGIRDPRLAVTELQLFAQLERNPSSNSAARLHRGNLPGQASITEALYDILVYHSAVRLTPFVEMVTHSATVNHGGGLRKDRERVYANPCHYAQAGFADFAGATPVPVEIAAATEPAPRVLPDLKRAISEIRFSNIDALAAVALDGSLLLSIVHRGSAGPIQLTVDVREFKGSDRVDILTLSADAPWSGNSLEAPVRIIPVQTNTRLREGQFELNIPRFTVLRVRIHPS